MSKGSCFGACRREPQNCSAGFGLLEAIVALALLAGSGMALFSWIQQSLQSATRLRTAEQEARLLLTAQALIETVNPADQSQGSMEVSGVTLRWQAEVVETPRRNVTFSMGEPGPWLVGLYRVRVAAQDREAGAAVDFMQLRTGLRRLGPAEGSP